MQFTGEVTKRGLVAFWEQGGGRTNTGEALIIARSSGVPPTATYVRKGGHLACGKHALVVIRKGDFIVRVQRWREEREIYIYRVRQAYVDNAQGIIEADEIARFDRGEWDSEPPIVLRAAIEAAIAKVHCYHCSRPHFANERENHNG